MSSKPELISPSMKIFLAADHRGLELKSELAAYLRGEGHEVIDCGAFGLVEDDDYPDFIIPAVARAVAEDAKAIVLGYSGQGEGIAANKVPGARAAVFYGGPSAILTLSREDNDANVLSLGAGFLSLEEARVAVDLWLSSLFSGEARHVRRLKKLEDGLEKTSV
jgi:ribose 5-phosphate isomerase B